MALSDVRGGLLGVHDKRFNSDDIHVAAGCELAGFTNRVIRTRNPEILATCDIRADVGGVYNPASCDFDHHMPGGAGKRDNGHPYSAIGLVWRHGLGLALCGTQELADLVDTMYIQPIDIRDCGSMKLPKAGPSNITYSLGDLVSAFNPDQPASDEHYDRAFSVVKEQAKDWLKNAIRAADREIKGIAYVRRLLEQKLSYGILVLEEFCPWYHTVQMYGRQKVKAVVFKPDGETGWRVQRMDGRKIPQAWHGKKGEDLIAITAVAEATFCTPSGHLVGASTKEGAIELAKMLGKL